jgi:hypothetical protein
MSTHKTADPVAHAFIGVRRTVLLAVGVIVAGAVLFFADLLALSRFREFIAGPGDGTLAREDLIAYRTDMLASHQVEVVLGYALIGVGTLMLGIGMAMIAKTVARVETGWQAAVATWASRALLAGGILGLVAYAWPGYWFSDDQLINIGFTTASVLGFNAGFAAIAFGFLGVAVVMVSGRPWPRWTGAPLVLAPILVLVSSLPLFFQLGAVIAGIGTVVGLRPKRLARTAP